jgi:hypothetical protein
MDTDPDPTPDPIPFFSDFKDVKEIKISSFVLIQYLTHRHIIYGTVLKINFFAKKIFGVKNLFRKQSAQRIMRKREGSGADSEPDPEPDLDPVTNGSGSGRSKNMRTDPDPDPQQWL